jgi:hypothetical protein
MGSESAVMEWRRWGSGDGERERMVGVTELWDKSEWIWRAKDKHKDEEYSNDDDDEKEDEVEDEREGDKDDFGDRADEEDDGECRYIYVDLASPTDEENRLLADELENEKKKENEEEMEKADEKEKGKEMERE